MIKCNNCDKEVEPILESAGKHIKASCSECKRYIKFVSQGLPATLYFGKYKGKLIEEVARIDLDYLHWLYGESKDEKLKDKIDAVLSHLD